MDAQIILNELDENMKGRIDSLDSIPNPSERTKNIREAYQSARVLLRRKMNELKVTAV